MAYSLTRLYDAPIIIFARDPGDNPIPDLLEVISQIQHMLDQQTEPVFLVFDIRGMLLDLEDMLIAARISASGRNAYLHHRNIRENVYINTDPMMRMGIRGLTTATFGMVHLSCFDTPEQALAHCYEKLGRALPTA